MSPRTRGALASVCLVLAVGCQSPPPAPPPTATAPVAMDAARAFERREWVLAARLLREALVRDPNNLTLHYHLAIAASHLDLRAEAIREFKWVLEMAARGSQEAETARRWLTEAGVLVAEGQPVGPVPDETTGDAALSGRVVWDAPAEAPVDTRRMQLFLIGLPDTPTREQRYVLRTDQEGRFDFKRIVAGPYRLTNRVAGDPTWRLKVQIEPGREQTLDLGPANSTRARDDFPDSRG